MEKCACGSTANLIKHSKKTRKDGTIYQTYQCRPCRNKRYRNWYYERNGQEVDRQRYLRYKTKQTNHKLIKKYATL